MTQPALTVVSDTPMQRRGDRLYALEVVVRELQALAPHFSRIVWYGFEQPLLLDAMVEVPPHVECHLWPSVGGRGLKSKLTAAASLPRYLAVAHQALSAPGVVHVRGPGLPALCVALRAQLGSTARVWFKYAGAWAPPSLPRSYRLYRSLVCRARQSMVTMTGTTHASMPHVVSLENPCLTAADRQQGAMALQAKRFDGPLTACFVGRVEEAKGFDRVLEALSRRPERFARLLVAGRVADEALQRVAKKCPVPVEFLGALEREQLNAVYAQSHVLLLPSRSEGFPKVVAEGWNFGCIPITSDAGALATEVSEMHGYVWREAVSPDFGPWFTGLSLSAPELNDMARNGFHRAAAFTYQKYVEKIVGLLDEDHGENSAGNATNVTLQSHASEHSSRD